MRVDAPAHEHASMPMLLWPKRDLSAWAAATASADFMSDDGLAAAWRPATRRSAVAAYGRWLSFLQSRDWLDGGSQLADRMSPVTLGAYVAFLTERGSKSVTVASYVGVLEMVFKAIAPGSNWSWLRSGQARLQRRAQPSRNKRGRLVPVVDLIALGDDLMGQADAMSSPGDVSLAAALAFRDGLIIALLAMRPLRQSNFISIEIGRHLIVTGDGYRLQFAGDETKNHRLFEFAFPPNLLAALRRYLEVYRPVLISQRLRRGASRSQELPAAGNRLWVTQYGTPFQPATLWGALEKRTTERFGHFINPHSFRDAVATDIATNDPEHVRIAAQILGHSDFATTEKHYIHAQAHVARRKYHDLVQSMRASSEKRQPIKKLGGRQNASKAG